MTRCLAKHPDDRWDTAHDVADELRWIAQSSSSFIAVPRPESVRQRWLARTVWAGATVAIAVIVALLAARFGVPGIASPQGSSAKAVAHLDIVLPADAPFWVDPQGFPPSLALSPDGSVIAYTCARGGASQICLRRLDRNEVVPIAGSEGGRFPAFSPDGQSVVFCVAGVQACEPGGPVKKIAVGNGRVDTLGTMPEGLQAGLASWSDDNRILLSGYGGIWTMPASGGTATPLLRVDATRGEAAYCFPALLSDGQRMLFSVDSRGGSFKSEVRVATLATGEQRVLIRNAFGALLPTGHFLYYDVTLGATMLAAFDAPRMVLGPPVGLWDPVRHFLFLGQLGLAVSRNGTLLYFPAEADRVLTWVDRQQRAVPALAAKGYWGPFRLSPDGHRVAMEVGANGVLRRRSRWSIWIAESRRESYPRA